MSNVNKFSTANIDFDKVREDLKNYLKGQDEFSDYNFEGSGLSVLLNSLAYNTSYNLVYQNFAVNEAFLDTAVKKSSVISHANTLNYTHRSRRSPVAKVSMTVRGTPESPSIIKLDAYSPFKTTVDGVTYIFYTIEDYTSTKENNIYFFENITLYEGVLCYAGGSYNNDDYQCFKLQDSSIDTTTIRVLVDEQSEGINTFNLSTKISGLDSTSKVYFLKSNPDESYQVEFGDGHLGQALKFGDIVSITYLSTNGTVCNGAKTFNYSGSLASQYDITSIVCTQTAVGGAEAEDIESIRKNAPKMYATQGRCVTDKDYKATVLAEYPSAKGVNVWGGEKMDPPQYGKVFISVVKKDGTTLTNDEKEYILENIVNPKKVLTTIVEFSDPTYIKIALSTNVFYDSSKTTNTTDDIKSSVIAAIKAFMDENIGSFDLNMRYSKLVSAIDNACDGITNNLTNISLVGELKTVYDSPVSYKLNLNNPIKKSASSEENILSSCFQCYEYDGYECYIDDEPSTERLRIFHLSESGKKNIDGYVGTVDYTNGIITIDSLTIKKLLSEKFEIFVNPLNNDVNNKENQFSILDEDRLTVEVTPN